MTHTDPVSASGTEGRPDLGPFRLLRKIGNGGMGTVFLAKDRRRAGANSLVALKRIHPHLLEDEQFVDMFFDEAEIASRISHPNVARVLDFGTLAEAPFLTMEYLQGRGLGAVRRAIAADDCPLDDEARFALLARVVADAAEGLHAAHELQDEDGTMMGVVHRDVSPQNIFVSYDGTSKVVDFGTVKADKQRHRTRTGFFKGKCAYIAPDTLLGKPIDRRSDIWSLGVVLWELLTNDRLFVRSTAAETLRAVMDHDVVDPTELVDVPAPLAAVAMKALSRAPHRRHRTALELAQELDAALAEVARVPASKAAVTFALDELFVGARAAAQKDTARLLDHPDENISDEELTMLWLDVDPEASECTSATRVAVREPLTTLVPSALPRAVDQATAGTDKWRMATGCLVAGLVGCLIGSSATDASAQPSRDAGSLPVSAAVAAPTPVAATVETIQASAPPTSPVVEIWSTDAEGRRQLLWSGSTSALVGSAVSPVGLRLTMADDASSSEASDVDEAGEAEPEDELRLDADREASDDGAEEEESDEPEEIEEPDPRWPTEI